VGEALEEFARRNGLSYVENGNLPGAGSGFTLSQVTMKGIAGGDLPGGLYGAVAWTEVQEGGAQYSRHVGVLLTRIPQSLTWLPYLVCKEDKKRGAVDRIFGPGGMIPIIRELDAVRFEEPPTSVEEAAKAYRKKTKGFLGLGGKEKARELGYAAVMGSYCEPRGLGLAMPHDFFVRAASLELPKTGLAYLTHGPIPGADLDGEFASLDFSEAQDKSLLAPAVFFERRSVDSVPVIRILPGDGGERLFLGGFRVDDPSGERVVSENERRSAEAAEELAQNRLDGDYKVEVALSGEGTPSLADALPAWLAAQDGRGTVILDGANACLIGAPVETEDWSHELIDDFFARAAGPVRALAA
jgi:hypothetical protein